MESKEMRQAKMMIESFIEEIIKWSEESDKKCNISTSEHFKGIALGYTLALYEVCYRFLGNDTVIKRYYNKNADLEALEINRKMYVIRKSKD